METQNKNPYQQVLGMFASSDTLRPTMCKPFRVDQFSATTDGGSVAFCKKDLVTECEPIELSKSVGDLIVTDDNENLVILISDLELIIQSAPMEPEYYSSGIPCPACKGDSFIEATFEYDGDIHKIVAECPVCDGSGDKHGPPRYTGKEIPSFTSIIGIGCSFFSIGYIQKLIKSASILQVDSITLVQQTEKQKASIFQIGEVRILLMPMMVPDSNQSVVGILSENGVEILEHL